MNKQETFTFDTRKAAKTEATRVGLLSGEYEIARDDSGYFIVWMGTPEQIIARRGAK